MDTRLVVVATLVVAVVATGAGLAHGANVVVQKNGQYPTIQEGILAAGVNGTVTVKPGVYEEFVSIPGFCDGLTLKASGNVIIDARHTNGAAKGPAIICAADDATIRGFTIRHASFANAIKPGVGVWVVAPRARLEKLKIVNCSQDGILIESTDAVVKKCSIAGCGYGVRGSAAHALVVENNVIWGCQSGGISAIGNSIVARKNSVRDCDELGLYVSGPTPIVEKNTVVNVGAAGIYADGEGQIVRGNKVLTTTLGAGIYTDGDDALIEKNTVVDAQLEGIRTNGSQITIRKNRVRGTAATQEGIYVSSGTGTTIEANVVERAGNYGIYALANSMVVRKNVVLRAGRIPESSAGFFLGGNDFTIEGNVAKDCCGDGYFISGDDFGLLDNVATGNMIDGFDVNGSSCNVTNNVALKNSGEGFDLGASNLSFQNNTAKNNRIDVAASVAPQSFQANNYGTGGTNVPPEID